MGPSQVADKADTFLAATEEFTSKTSPGEPESSCKTNVQHLNPIDDFNPFPKQSGL